MEHGAYSEIITPTVILNLFSAIKADYTGIPYSSIKNSAKNISLAIKIMQVAKKVNVPVSVYMEAQFAIDNARIDPAYVQLNHLLSVNAQDRATRHYHQIYTEDHAQRNAVTFTADDLNAYWENTISSIGSKTGACVQHIRAHLLASGLLRTTGGV